MLGDKYIEKKEDEEAATEAREMSGYLKPELKKWSIQIDYTARNDDGKQFRARSTFQCEAGDIPSAYRLAEEADWGGYEPVKSGVIMPGWHVLIGSKITPAQSKAMDEEEKAYQKALAKFKTDNESGKTNFYQRIIKNSEQTTPPE